MFFDVAILRGVVATTHASMLHRFVSLFETSPDSRSDYLHYPPFFLSARLGRRTESEVEVQESVDVFKSAFAFRFFFPSSSFEMKALSPPTVLRCGAQILK